MMNYRKLTQDIHTPEGLNDRVLFQTRRQAAPQRKQNHSHFFFRAAVCAACAVALVLGGISLRPATNPASPDGSVVDEDISTTVIPAYNFVLKAYAAMTGEAIPTVSDGKLTFSIGEGLTNPGEGDFTGCLFQVTGEEIATVAISIDKGALYRYQMHTNLTDEEMYNFRVAMEEGRLTTAAISQTDDGMWYMPEMTAVGTELQEDYDPDLRYGFWLPPEEIAYDTGLGITTEAQMDLDRFDGAALTITVTTTSGLEKTQVYRLHTGMLKVEFREDNDIVFLPELADDDDPCAYGIYAELEA